MTTTTERDRITLTRTSTGWKATYDGPHCARIITLFGRCTIPTAYGPTAPSGYVLHDVTSRNPNAIVTVAGDDRMKTPQPIKGSFTPWGPAEGIDHVCPGIVIVTTASHGGAWVSAERLPDIPARYQRFAERWSKGMGPQWYEEDVAVIAPLAFCHGVPESTRTHAMSHLDMIEKATDRMEKGERMKTITLRYRATCRACRSHLSVGSTAVWYGKGRIACQECTATVGGPVDDTPGARASYDVVKVWSFYDPNLADGTCIGFRNPAGRCEGADR